MQLFLLCLKKIYIMMYHYFACSLSFLVNKKIIHAEKLVASVANFYFSIHYLHIQFLSPFNPLLNCYQKDFPKE